MSKGIKTVAAIALPIVGNIIAPGIGGAIGGAIGGGISGGAKGAILGAIGGYASGGAVNSVIGNSAGSTLAKVTGNSLLQGPTAGSGIVGALTGGGVRSLGTSLVQGATSAVTDPSKLLLGIGNQVIAQSGADAAKKAANIQSTAADAAIATQKPYTELGQNAVNQINTIQADPGAYIQQNPFYNSLAKDAERRLLANQAAKGKVGSGGTAAMLQDQLLQLGTGLVNQQINTLQDQAGIGKGSAATVSNLQTGQGAVRSAGVIGANDAMTAGYNNQIKTLLALQEPVYQPSQIINR